jgi:hypothetical protein
MAMSKFRSKGHCGLEAMMNGRVRGQGHSARAHLPELRMMGKTRRIGRKEVPEYEMEEAE